VNPTWAKGYARKGAALHGQRRYVEAIETYEGGLKIEDGPALRKGLDEVKAAKGALLDFRHSPLFFLST
jgi:stress-induced-phosphoprotein 1